MATTKADFSQRDPRWSGQMLGFATWQTMGGYGCLVTAFANIAQAQGKDVTPADVNQMLRERKLFVTDGVGQKSDVAGPTALETIFPDIKNVENVYWGNKLADINFFDIRKSATDDIVVLLDYHPERAGMQHHYCRVIGINDARNDVEIVDSYTGKRVWVSSLGLPANRLIYSAYKYHGPGAGFGTVTPEPQPSHLEAVKGGPGQRWNVRTAPSMGGAIREGYVVPGQTYDTQIVDGGWRKISFRGVVGYVGPAAWR